MDKNKVRRGRLANSTDSSTDPEKALERLERRYEIFGQFGICVLGVLAVICAFRAASGEPAVTSARASYAIAVITALLILVGVGYFILTMRSMRMEIGKKRAKALPSRAERIELIRRVGELSAVLDASRELESARNMRELASRLATESEALSSADAALVVLCRKGTLSIAAATDATDRDDVALATQCRFWSAFLQDGGLPFLATGKDSIQEAFGDGPLADRYGSAMEVPLLANGRLIGLVVVLRRIGSGLGFDAGGLQAVGLLADLASHLILLRRVNARMRRTNRRLLQSMDQLECAQVQLVQTERLRAVGELVSGVAHELNNPLTSLLGFAQLLTLNNSVASDSEKKWVDEIQREAGRCSVILNNLLQFARRSAVNGVFSATASIVSETLALKSYDLRSARIEVKNEVPGSLPAAALERQELQQILLNLINNAVAAMRPAKERVLTLRGCADDERVCLEIVDSGVGIPDDQIERIFEPFYTTKARGDSIGLGLTTCRKILSACGGSVAVRSRLGEGSTFTVLLPRVRDLVIA